MPDINPDLVPLLESGELFDKLANDESFAVRWLTSDDPVFFEALNRPDADLFFRQLVIAKVLSEAGNSFALLIKKPFINQPILENDVEVPVDIISDMHINFPESFEVARLMQITKLSGTKEDGTLRFIFGGHDGDSTTEPVAVCYADYETGHPDTFQFSRVKIATVLTVEDAELITFASEVVDGYVLFRTLDDIDEFLDPFFDSDSGPVHFDVVGGSGFDTSIEASSGALTPSAVNYLRDVDAPGDQFPTPLESNSLSLQEVVTDKKVVDRVNYSVDPLNDKQHSVPYTLGSPIDSTLIRGFAVGRVVISSGHDTDDDESFTLNYSYDIENSELDIALHTNISPDSSLNLSERAVVNLPSSPSLTPILTVTINASNNRKIDVYAYDDGSELVLNVDLTHDLADFDWDGYFTSDRYAPTLFLLGQEDTLVGKTYVPLSRDNKAALDDTSGGVSAGTINLETDTGVSVPEGATHALLTVRQFDGAFSGSGTVALRIAQNGIALDDEKDTISEISINSPSNINGTDTGAVVVELDSSAPEIQWDTIAFGALTISSLRVEVDVEGYFIDENVSVAKEVTDLVATKDTNVQSYRDTIFTEVDVADTTGFEPLSTTQHVVNHVEDGSRRMTGVVVGRFATEFGEESEEGFHLHYSYNADDKTFVVHSLITIDNDGQDQSSSATATLNSFASTIPVLSQTVNGPPNVLNVYAYDDDDERLIINVEVEDTEADIWGWDGYFSTTKFAPTLFMIEEDFLDEINDTIERALDDVVSNKVIGSTGYIFTSRGGAGGTSSTVTVQSSINLTGLNNLKPYPSTGGISGNGNYGYLWETDQGLVVVRDHTAFFRLEHNGDDGRAEHGRYGVRIFNSGGDTFLRFRIRNNQGGDTSSGQHVIESRVLFIAELLQEGVSHETIVGDA